MKTVTIGEAAENLETLVDAQRGVVVIHLIKTETFT
jgi:hypothetical protein